MNYAFDFGAVLSYWPVFIKGCFVTLFLAFAATICGFIVGTVCAVMRTSGPRWAAAIAGAYVEIIRNTPLLTQCYFIIFGLASTGFRLPILVAAVLVLVINIGAYTTEVMRAGISSIKKSQIEAAECLGMSRVQVFLHIILRPAMERVYPTLGGQYILLMLASSLLSGVGVDELAGSANIIQSETFRNFEVYIVLGVLYLALSLIMRIAFMLLGRMLFPRRRELGTAL